MKHLLMTTVALAALLPAAAMSQNQPAPETPAVEGVADGECEQPIEGNVSESAEITDPDCAEQAEDTTDPEAAGESEVTGDEGAMPAEGEPETEVTGDEDALPAEDEPETEVTGDEDALPAEGEPETEVTGDDGALPAEGEPETEVTGDDGALPAEGDADAEADVAADPEASDEVPPVALDTRPATDLTAEEMIGANVYDATGDDIGEISDIVFTSAGEPEAAIIDVGGFLGLGEHRVALEMDKVAVVSSQDNPDDWHIQVTLSEEELDALPEYEKPAN